MPGPGGLARGNGKNTLQFDCEHPTATPAGAIVRVRFDLSLDLAPGEYTFNLGFSTLSREDFARRAGMALSLESIFFMGALLYPEDYQDGDRNDLERFLDRFEAA